MSKVLIFESDHAFAVELRTELSVLGCTVQVFKEGATGLMAASQGAPDLILISADLRPMNGFSICNKLKKDPTLQRVPVILMSADQSEETFEQHRKLRTRADDYVRKPIAMSELVSRIRELMPLAGSTALGTTRIVEDEAPRPAGDAQLRLDVRIEPSRLPLPEADSALTSVQRAAAEPKPESLRFLQYALGEDDGDEATRQGVRIDEPDAPPSPAPRLGSLLSTQILFDDEVDHAPAPVTAVEPASPLSIDADEEDDDGATSVVDVSSSLAVVSPGPPPVPSPRPPLASAPPASSPPVSAPPVPSPRPPLASAPPSSDTQASPVAGLDLVDPGGAGSLAQLRHALLQSHQELQRLRPQVTELSRARVELAELRRELALAREASSSAAEAESLRQRLHRSEEELVALRDESNQRHRELLDARAQSVAHQREIVELRDVRLSFEQRAAEAIARLDAVHADKALAERAVDDWRDNHRKLAAELEQLGLELRARQAEHEAELERVAREREEFVLRLEERLRRELSSGDASHAAVVAELEGRLAAAATERASIVERSRVELAALEASLEEGLARRLAHAVEAGKAELEAQKASHARELAERDAEHATTLERIRAEHAAALERRDARGESELGSMQDELARLRALADTEARRAEDLAERLGAVERQRALTEARAVELEQEIRRTRDETDAALRSGDLVAAERAAWQLAEADSRRQREALEARLATIDAAHAADVASLDATHRAELERQAESFAERERALELEAAEQVRGAIADLEAQRTRLAAELEAMTEERDEAAHSAQSRAGRIGELDRAVGELARAVEERDARLRQVEADLARLREEDASRFRGELASLAERHALELAAADERLRAEREAYDVQLVRLRSEFDTAQAGLQRARERWSEDRVALQKARDAISALIAASERDG